MTERDPDDAAAPVVLQEPQRDRPATDWAEGFTLRPEEAGVPGLHPGWAEVLAEGETPLWQGRPTPDPRVSVFANLPVLFFVAVLAVVVLQSGGGLWPFIALGFGFFWLVRRKRGAKVASDRLYLLTNRAAYLARDRHGALADILSYPITPGLRLGLGPRSVSFATRRGARGEMEAEGFLDISDARQVHDLIRDLQKGKA